MAGGIGDFYYYLFLPPFLIIFWGLKLKHPTHKAIANYG